MIISTFNGKSIKLDIPIRAEIGNTVPPPPPQVTLFHEFVPVDYLGHVGVRNKLHDASGRYATARLGDWGGNWNPGDVIEIQNSLNNNSGPRDVRIVGTRSNYGSWVSLRLRNGYDGDVGVTGHISDTPTFLADTQQVSQFDFESPPTMLEALTTANRYGSYVGVGAGDATGEVPYVPPMAIGATHTFTDTGNNFLDPYYLFSCGEGDKLWVTSVTVSGTSPVVDVVVTVVVGVNSEHGESYTCRLLGDPAVSSTIEITRNANVGTRVPPTFAMPASVTLNAMNYDPAAGAVVTFDHYARCVAVSATEWDVYVYPIDAPYDQGVLYLNYINVSAPQPSPTQAAFNLTWTPPTPGPAPWLPYPNIYEVPAQLPFTPFLDNFGGSAGQASGRFPDGVTNFGAWYDPLDEATVDGANLVSSSNVFSYVLTTCNDTSGVAPYGVAMRFKVSSNAQTGLYQLQARMIPGANEYCNLTLNVNGAGFGQLNFVYQSSGAPDIVMSTTSPVLQLLGVPIIVEIRPDSQRIYVDGVAVAFASANWTSVLSASAVSPSAVQIGQSNSGSSAVFSTDYVQIYALDNAVEDLSRPIAFLDAFTGANNTPLNNRAPTTDVGAPAVFSGTGPGAWSVGDASYINANRARLTWTESGSAATAMTFLMSDTYIPGCMYMTMTGYESTNSGSSVAFLVGLAGSPSYQYSINFFGVNGGVTTTVYAVDAAGSYSQSYNISISSTDKIGLLVVPGVGYRVYKNDTQLYEDTGMAATTTVTTLIGLIHGDPAPTGDSVTYVDKVQITSGFSTTLNDAALELVGA